MEKQRGGKRPGAGRKPKPKGEKFINVTVSLPPGAALWAARLGGGASSKSLPAIRRGIVKALTLASEPKE